MQRSSEFGNDISASVLRSGQIYEKIKFGECLLPLGLEYLFAPRLLSMACNLPVLPTVLSGFTAWSLILRERRDTCDSNGHLCNIHAGGAFERDREV